MTVTLDDVHSLFHLPIAGTFFTIVDRDQVTTLRMVMNALEVDELVVLKEFGDTRDFHLKMSWLRKVYQELVDAGRYQVAARAYMLHLVAFTDKSGVYIYVRYLSLFSDLDIPCWAWEVAALTMLYTALDVASRPDTRQLADYLSLLRCWIYEHFPHICERKTQHCAAADHCARRWKARQILSEGVIEYRRRLNALTLDDVIWAPYTCHRNHLPFDVSLYSGYVRWKSHVARHLPERCLRQYESHPQLPLEILDTPVAVQQPGQCQDGYLEWFPSVSHPTVIPSAAASDVPEPSSIKASSDPPPPPPPPDMFRVDKENNINNKQT
ncbi:protein MAIN-LIKE 1-like [Vicia villosa]|uniref:protein MAIN-LIKE 1-like n=1 Tax=Vicia villosa TaxID=3911 RepID=UPI00273B2C22|nr:protein MAIN-LIKE 1-like [Vicia villosa]